MNFMWHGVLDEIYAAFEVLGDNDKWIYTFHIIHIKLPAQEKEPGPSL